MVDDVDWTYYRGIYFSVVSSYSLYPEINTPKLFLNLVGTSAPERVQALGMCISAWSDDGTGNGIGNRNRNVDLLPVPKLARDQMISPTAIEFSPHPSGDPSILSNTYCETYKPDHPIIQSQVLEPRVPDTSDKSSQDKCSRHTMIRVRVRRDSKG